MPLPQSQEESDIPTVARSLALLRRRNKPSFSVPQISAPSPRPSYLWLFKHLMSRSAHILSWEHLDSEVFSPETLLKKPKCRQLCPTLWPPTCSVDFLEDSKN